MQYDTNVKKLMHKHCKHFITDQYSTPNKNFKKTKQKLLKILKISLSVMRYSSFLRIHDK